MRPPLCHSRRSFPTSLPATLWICALLMAVIGCAQRAGFDSSGRRIFDYGPAPQPIVGATPVGTTPAIVAPAPIAAGNIPAPTFPAAVALPGVTLTPGRLVAPVGNEVLLVAAVHLQGRPQAPYQRVEWLLNPPSVGGFLATGRSDRPLFGLSAQKLDNSYAVSETAAISRVLTRGTAAPADDVTILPGQSWITLSSPIEGVSYVTAFAPDLQGAGGNRQTAAVYWVDARWTLSPTRTIKTGSIAPLTVNVYRQTTGQPVPNWLVKYKVSGGPPANLGTGAAQTAEVLTNAAGQATIDLTQVNPQVGTNLVTVELVRPTEATPNGIEPLLVGTANTQVVWSDTAPPTTVDPTPGGLPAPTPVPGPVPGRTPAPNPNPTPNPTQPAPFRVTLRGPAQGIVGQEATFIADVQNLSNETLSGLRISLQQDVGLQLSSGAPPIKREIDPLKPGGNAPLTIRVRPTKPGQLCQTVLVEGPNGTNSSARSCFNVQATTGGIGDLPKISLNLTSPQGRTFTLGQQADFRIELLNNSDKPITGLQVVAQLDPELVPLEATTLPNLKPDYSSTNKTVTWRFPDLPADAKIPVLTILTEKLAKPTAAGRPARVRVTATADGLPLSQEVTVEVFPPRAAAPTEGSVSRIGFRRIEGTQFPVGTRVDYEYSLINEGTVADQNVVLSVTFPPQLKFDERSITGPLKFRINGQTITFEPVPQLPPTVGSPPPAPPITIRIRTLADQPGKVETTAQLTSVAIPAGVSLKDALEIYSN